MTTYPRVLRGNEKLTATWLRELIDCIKRITPIAGPGLTSRNGPNGTVLSVPAATARKGRSESALLPWTFKCSVRPADEEDVEEEEGSEEERVGGWTNCRLQIGFDLGWHSPDLDAGDADPDKEIVGTDLCDDGVHYLEVTLANGSAGRESDQAEIKVASLSAGMPESDYIGGKIRIWLGVVSDGKIGYTPHMNPVVYKYV